MEETQEEEKMTDRCIDSVMRAMQSSKEYKIFIVLLMISQMVYFTGIYLLIRGMYEVAFIVATIGAAMLSIIIMTLHVMILASVLCEGRRR